MGNETAEIPFSPILIMEFIRQTTVARFFNAENTDNFSVKFKLPKKYYEAIISYPLQVQRIRLQWDYNVETEILTVKTDDVLLNRFREQKSLVEIAEKYEKQYAERYNEFIKVAE